MSDERSQRNAANAMFGLNEPRGSSPAPETPAQPAGVPPGPGTPGQSAAPQYIYVQSPPAAPLPAPAAATAALGTGLRVLGIILVVLTAANIYLWYNSSRQLKSLSAKQSDQLNLLARRLDSSDERDAQLSGKFQVTAEKLGLTQQELGRARQLAANIEKQQQQAVSQLNAAIAQKASAQQLNQLQADSTTKFGSLSGDIAGTRKDLEATKEALTGAKGELSGAIARTHDELVTLAHKTDRDYFEFHLASRGARQKVGSVTIQLVKTNTKKNLYSTYLYFDDKRTLRHDEAVDSPIFFYVQGGPNALELVVNKIGKNTIAGYLSSPKGFFQNTPNILSARPEWLKLVSAALKE